MARTIWSWIGKEKKKQKAAAVVKWHSVLSARWFQLAPATSHATQCHLIVLFCFFFCHLWLLFCSTAMTIIRLFSPACEVLWGRQGQQVGQTVPIVRALSGPKTCMMTRKAFKHLGWVALLLYVTLYSDTAAHAASQNIISTVIDICIMPMYANKCEGYNIVTLLL